MLLVANGLGTSLGFYSSKIVLPLQSLPPLCRLFSGVVHGFLLKTEGRGHRSGWRWPVAELSGWRVRICNMSECWAPQPPRHTMTNVATPWVVQFAPRGPGPDFGPLRRGFTHGSAPIAPTIASRRPTRLPRQSNMALGPSPESPRGF